eukprot:gene191-201_t
MVWHRSFVRLAERTDIHPALKKLWKKHYQVDGLVTQHLSPFEQRIVTPLLKELPIKILKKVKEGLVEAGIGLGVGIAVYYWAEAKHKELAFHHRA